jgi:hypothetical protein
MDKKKVEVVHCLLVDICCTFLQIIAEHLNIGKGTDSLIVEQTVEKRSCVQEAMGWVMLGPSVRGRG